MLESNIKNHALSKIDWSWLEKPAAVVQEAPLLLPESLVLAWRMRGDLQATYSMDTPEGRLGLVYWWISHGAHYNKLFQLTDHEKSILAELDHTIPQDSASPITVGMAIVWRARPDLQKTFSLDSESGRNDFVTWWQQSSEKEQIEHQQLLNTNDEEVKNSARHFAQKKLGTYLPDGVNVTGFAKMSKGVGEDARMAIEAVTSAKIPYSVLDVEEIVHHKRKECFPVYQTNLICTPADEVMHFLFYVGSGYFNSRYTIGAWQWELPHWPEKFNSSFRLLQEVWAFSHYAEKMFKEATSLPVHYVPLAVQIPEIPLLNRADLSLPENKFLFLIMFDGHSWCTRKNPLAAVKAFLAAFPAKEQGVGLVIKGMNLEGNHPDWQEIVKIATKDPRIILKIEVLPRSHVIGLINNCDAYVSLHRAEGFGRIIAEAMLLGKPVIVTNFSGNTDFCTAKTALLVDGPLIPLKAGDYCGWEGQYWCDPDIEIAAEQMRKCVSDESLRKSIATAGAELIRTNHSIDAVSKIYKERLKAIYN